jgi:hypothetical protein
MKRKKQRPTIQVPLYYSPSEEELNEILNTPEEERAVSGTQKFYRSLRYSDDEIDLQLWEDHEREIL